jgi:putative membrane protein
MPDTLAANVIAALVFALLGITVLVVSFFAFDRLTPYRLWKEIIDEHNTALAILIGAIALGMSIIVAAAIH